MRCIWISLLLSLATFSESFAWKSSAGWKWERNLQWVTWGIHCDLHKEKFPWDMVQCTFVHACRRCGGTYSPFLSAQINEDKSSRNKRRTHSSRYNKGWTTERMNSTKEIFIHLYLALCSFVLSFDPAGGCSYYVRNICRILLHCIVHATRRYIIHKVPTTCIYLIRCVVCICKAQT